MNTWWLTNLDCFRVWNHCSWKSITSTPHHMMKLFIFHSFFKYFQNTVWVFTHFARIIHAYVPREYLQSSRGSYLTILLQGECLSFHSQSVTLSIHPCLQNVTFPWSSLILNELPSYNSIIYNYICTYKWNIIFTHMIYVYEIYYMYM